MAPEESTNSRYTKAREWVLLTGNRAVLAGAILLLVAVLLTASLLTGVAGVQNSDPITRTFSALIGGNLTLITIIISINQLILAREFATPDELEDRIDEMLAYRREAEQLAATRTSPITPDEFLDFLSHSMAGHAQTLRESAAETDDASLRTAIKSYADRLIDQSEQTSTVLEEREHGAFDAVIVVFDIGFVEDLHTARRLRAQYADDLPTSARDGLEDIIQLLESIGVARQYFKTLYLQRELAEVSRLLFYVGVPAVVVSLLANWFFGHQGILTDTVFQAIILLSTIVALSPLIVLFAYIVRAATIAKRTAALMPFAIRDETDV